MTDQYADRGAIPGWLARELVAAREHLGLSKEQAAARCGCSRRTLHHLEQADRRPSRSMAEDVIAGLRLRSDLADALLEHSTDQAGRDRPPDGPDPHRPDQWATPSGRH